MKDPCDLSIGMPDYDVPDVVKEAAKVMGGGGGGRPEMAQAGGRQPEKLEEALRAAVEVAARQAAGSDTA